MDSRRPLLSLPALLALAAAVLLAACGDDPGATPPFVNPPPLPTVGVTWINADAPLSIAKLSGKVVLLEFGWLH